MHKNIIRIVENISKLTNIVSYCTIKTLSKSDEVWETGAKAAADIAPIFGIRTKKQRGETKHLGADPPRNSSNNRRSHNGNDQEKNL